MQSPKRFRDTKRGIKVKHHTEQKYTHKYGEVYRIKGRFAKYIPKDRPLIDPEHKKVRIDL